MATKKSPGIPSTALDDLMQQEPREWGSMAPVGREFGSSEFERLAELDDLAVKATGSLLAARNWLDTPNPALDGQIPEELARSPDGYAQVERLLDALMGAA
jgi:uncharacterized protein (DUF2384 family)